MTRAEETFFMVKIIQEQWDPPVQRMEPKGLWTMESEQMSKWKPPFPMVVIASWQTALEGFSSEPDNRYVLYISFSSFLFFNKEKLYINKVINTVMCKSSQIKANTTHTSWQHQQIPFQFKQ